ncbi:CaiB/BaiF CoA transferase family protein [Aeromicrobium sp. CTD01-1L150]|uniref:CaiB/BaiF CoA transferase family protein n=1 Tax=Aeromicrobium sp. CTD01-1L150 TaxID=3341830 RepID=UPI0035C1ECF6
MPASSEGPLAGVRILDLTAMLAGPYSTMILSDLGADVVKIEPPSGDVTRGSGPRRPGDGPRALNGYFQSINRGKSSLVMDLREPATRETFLDLVRRADVLMENYSTGVMDRLDLSYETLHEENPRLVYGALRGFGDPRLGRSPYADWPAFDVVAQAMGGHMSITGTNDGHPIKSGPGIGDIFPGTLLAVGVLAALRHVERTGQGQFVDVAMMDSMIALCERAVYQYSYLDQVAGPIGNSHPLLYPFDVFESNDGWIALAGNKDSHWAIIAEAMERPDLVTDDRYSTNNARVQNRATLAPIVEEWVRAHTNAQLVEMFGGRVPIGPVKNTADLFDDPHVHARQMLVEVEQPDSSTPVTIAGVPLKFSTTPAHVRGRGPHLGEQTPDEIAQRWSDGRSGA